MIQVKCYLGQMIANGFTIAQFVELVRAALATQRPSAWPSGRTRSRSRGGGSRSGMALAKRHILIDYE
jgi:hypothetical protein